MPKTKIERIGETILQNTVGINATIISYRSAKDIDIRFDNGQVANDIQYYNFKTGQVKCPMIVEYIEDYCRLTNPNTKANTVFLIDKNDLERVIALKWWYANDQGYIVNDTIVNNMRLHRFIMDAPDGVIIDHKNCNPADNRKQNLRICNRSQNTMNRGSCKIAHLNIKEYRIAIAIKYGLCKFRQMVKAFI